MDLEQMDKKLDKIDIKLDRLDVRLDRVETGLVIVSKDLKYHIKRTDLLEDEVKPLRERYQQLQGIAKFLAAVIAASALLEIALRFIHPS